MTTDAVTRSDAPEQARPEVRRSLVRRSGAIGAGAVLATGSAAALLTALATPASAAATFTVDDNTDSVATGDPTHCTDVTVGNCTLRDAAAAASDGDTIEFAAGISSIVIHQGRIDFLATNITGPGASNLTISTFDPGPYAALYFSNSGVGDVVLSGFTLTTNRIYAVHDGDLTLDHVSVTGSHGSYGGALYAVNTGDLHIVDSEFSDNNADQKGAAVYAYNYGEAIISGTTFRDNSTPDSAGGLWVSGNVTNASITDCVFEGNYAGSSAGAVFAKNYGTLTIDRTTIDDNEAYGTGGGLYVNGNVTHTTISNSTISNNRSKGSLGYGGGGAFFYGAGTVEIDNSTLTGNVSSVGAGGALYLPTNGSEVTINQSTIVGNTAPRGGGIWTGGDSVALSGTIVSANISADPAPTGPGGASLVPSHPKNGVTSVQGHGRRASALLPTADPASADIGGTSATVTSDHSLVGVVDDGAGYITFTDLGGTIRSSTPGVAALADNGGPTRTMALDPTSAAVDAGPVPVATFTGNENDQRGTGYKRTVNGVVDIGAFEIQPPPEPTTTTTTTTVDDAAVTPTFTG